MAKEDDLFETWSIDSPLEEIVDVHVPYEEAAGVNLRKPSPLAAKNGKAKAVQSKARKKKPVRRHKS